MKSDYNIFIVEDDKWYREILQFHLGLNPDFKVTTFETAKACLSHMHLQPDLITIDFSLPDMTGDKLYCKIREINQQLPVIVISGQEDIAVAVDLLKMGVSDYIVKDDATKDLLWSSVNRIRENQSLKKEVEYLRKELGSKFSFEKTIIGQSDALKKVFLMIEKAIKTNINISISGETGTGKEVVAKAIHYNSTRKHKKFVAVNMAAIPAELIESELFGSEKGAYTGSVERKIGKFEEANGGTIFLDEIADLDFGMQSKLLRVIQEREVVRLGSNDSIKLDVRLIVASHKYLNEEVKKEKFREDLYFRILGLPIHLPPLRERANDILVLAKHFAEIFAADNQLGTVQFSNDAKNKLLHYHFPGNVRELKAVIELAVVMKTGDEIKADDITFSAATSDEIFLTESKTLRKHTHDIIKHYLKKCNNDINATAAILGIGKSTIYKMIQMKELQP